MAVLHTDMPGLRLQPLQPADADSMFELLQDQSIYRYLDDQPPESVHQLRAVYERRARGRSADGVELWFNWIVRRDPDTAMGFVQATIQASGRCLVAYVLASPYQGRGYASAAVRAMLQNLKMQHHVRQFWVTVEADNTRSIRLLERLGFGSVNDIDAVDFELTPTERLFAVTL